MNELSRIDSECIRCGICEEQQRLEGMPVIQVGDVAQKIEAAASIEELSPEVYEFLVACSLCNACTASCPQELSCADAVKAGRDKLHKLMPSLEQSYRAYRVDFKENVFAALRETAGTNYEDVLDSEAPSKEGQSIFFPGCSLAGYSSELTMAAYEFLAEHNAVQGISAFCCGKVLGDAGVVEAQDAYGKSLVQRIKDKGVSTIVVACPNCYYELQRLFKIHGVREITLKVLPEQLATLGLEYKESDIKSISLHTSCPDRFEQSFVRSTLDLLDKSGVEFFVMESHGRDTICCGAGGMARMNAPTLAAERRNRRIKEFAHTGAECLVCSCMSCVNTFLGDFNAPHTKHYLELLFGIDIDWQQANVVYDKMVLEHEAMFTLALDESTPTFKE